MVQTIPLKVVQDSPQLRLEADGNFFHTGYRRLVYVSKSPHHPFTPLPHRFPTSLTILPIPVDSSHNCTITFEAKDGSVVEKTLRASHSYFVPAFTAFQIRAEGLGVIELFTPVPTGGQLPGEETLAADFFQKKREDKANETKC
jgi:hypothetical protein